ncbi:MAG TPA: hypothetical protein VKM55_00360 [Candidatus Lokiarchaeia archaeon]|nr:hypothetical protein [Candidatus Lokiarchaeia archaeon]
MGKSFTILIKQSSRDNSKPADKMESNFMRFPFDIALPNSSNFIKSDNARKNKIIIY